MEIGRQPPPSSWPPGRWLNFSQVCTHYIGVGSGYLAKTKTTTKTKTEKETETKTETKTETT